MKKGSEQKGGKTGAGVPPKGVFQRIAQAEKQSGEKKIIRHTADN